MAITGRGDFDFNSAWLSRGRGRGRGRFDLLYSPITSANENTDDLPAMWNDWFFEAAASVTAYYDIGSPPHPALLANWRDVDVRSF